MYLSTQARSRTLLRDNAPYRDFRLAARFALCPIPADQFQRVEARRVGLSIDVTLPGNPLDTGRAAAAGWKDPLTFNHAGRNSWYLGPWLGMNSAHVVDAAVGASAHHDTFGPMNPLHWLIDFPAGIVFQGPVKKYYCSIRQGCYTPTENSQFTPLGGRCRFAGLGVFSPPPSNIQTVLQNAASSSGVPYSILSALAFQESSYNPSAVSPKGAQGLLQLMPATGASLGVSDPFNAQQNANAGASYLASLYKQFGNWNDALVAYNEGPGAFARSGAYPSAQSYADAILANAGALSSPAPNPSGPSGDSSYGLPDLPAGSFSVDFTDPLVLGALALLGVGVVAWMAA